MNKDWHSIDSKECLEILGTSEETGLSSEEAQRRLQQGRNIIEEKRKVHPIIKFFQQFRSIPILMLICAAIITIALTLLTDEDHTSDTIAILIAIVINAIMGYAMESRAEKAMEALKKMTSPKANVIRDGMAKEIPVEELVPGDIVLLEEGDRVPADIRLIEANNMEVDESMLTGESIPVPKSAEKCSREVKKWERSNIVYMGTVVVRGRGKGVVVSTGMNTELGKIAKLVQESEREETPLQKNIDKLGKQIGYIAMAVSVIVFLIAYYVSKISISYSFLLAVSLAVAIIPEGLPVVLVVTLAIGMQIMAKKNAIVRRLMSVETLGCVTVICSDKTGTLTKNQMTVKEVYIYDEFLKVSGSGYEPVGEIEKLEEYRNSIELLVRIGVLCNNANLLEEDGRWKVIGDPTEGALLSLAGKAKIIPKEYHLKYRRIYEKIFDPRKKLMSTINEVDGKIVIHTKGAPEVILDLSTQIFVRNKVLPLTQEIKNRIYEANRHLASKGYRVLALGFKEVDKVPENKEDMERGMVFVGLVGIVDPLRPEVKEAIRVCKEAGIKVVMITGDQKDTAIAIAKELDIWNGKILTGDELEKLNDDQLTEIVEDVNVYARVQPEMKLKIVRALKRKGHVVAMTGDGVNDAPALANADVGVSMGLSGTEVAKEASAIVLADDNFATIVRAVEEGRRIYENIRKFVRYQITTNIGATTLMLLSILLIPGAIPLYPVQILWINILIDGPPAQALGLEPSTKKIMKQRPRNPKEHILNKDVVIAILVNGICMALLTLFIFWYSYNFTPTEYANKRISYAQTMTFTSFVIFQLFSVLNCRNLYESVFKLSWNNRFLLYAIFAALSLQLFAVYTPFMNNIFKTIPLRAMDWVIIFLLGLILIAIDETRKYIYRKRKV